jgi:hypothetical protein
MTSGDTATVPEPSEATEPGPKKWAVYNLAGRDIEFAMPSPEQLMVLRRVARQISSPDATISGQITGMGKVLDAISACMVNPADSEYADGLVLDRKIELEGLVPMITAVLRGPNAQQAEPAKPKRVRRR